MDENATVAELKWRCSAAEAALRIREAELRDRDEVAAELRAAVAAMREREESYRAVFEAMDEGVITLDVICDADGKAIDAIYVENNAALGRMTGLTIDIVGKRISEVLPNLEPFWFDNLGRVIKTGEPSRFEHTVRDLADQWFDVFASRVGGEGSPRIVLVYNNSTVRKRAETALRENEARQRILIGSWAQAVWETDAAGVVVTDSPSWRAYTGQTLDEWLGYGWLDAIHPDDRAYAERQWREAIAVRGLVNAEFRLRAPDGGWRWTNVRAVPVLDESGIVEKWAGMNIDIDDRKRAEQVLRDSEERQAFLLKFSDALRPLTNPIEIMTVAARVTGEFLNLDRCGYGQVDPTVKHLFFPGTYLAPGMSMFPERIQLESFSKEFAAIIGNGDTLVVDDMQSDMRLTDPSQSLAFSAAQVVAFVGVPLIKEGRLVAILFAHQSSARQWTRNEIAALEDVAERTWAAVGRAKAETAWRDSEERFRQFGKASSDALWIRDAETLAMEYVSPAMRTIYGIDPDALLGDVRKWGSLVVPDDRGMALGQLSRAQDGESIVHEFRIQRPSDGCFRWVRDTDFPLLDEAGRVQRIGGIAQDVTETKLAAEHQTVLVAELQHRVRNIMAMIRSVVARTGERAGSVAEYTSALTGRMLALARVQALLTRAANVEVDVASIVKDEVSAQAESEGQYVLEGPGVALSPKAAEVLTLAVHELSTNALKYGALSVPAGKVTVRWSTFEKDDVCWLSFDWTEEGAPRQRYAGAGSSHRRGFGSELIEGKVPYELRGESKITIEAGGARCHIEFPLTEGSSILETGAPERAIVFGGALDMTGESDLSGHRVLVVEDDYYLATDTARALQGAGAAILGPCATEADARRELEGQTPTAVVLDINLGSGPSFKLAEFLNDRGIPFVFITGYDQAVIPAEFEGVGRLQKPVQLRQIVAAISRLVAAGQARS